MLAIHTADILLVAMIETEIANVCTVSRKKIENEPERIYTVEM